MIVTLADGTVKRLPWTNCYGYVASKIELEASDVKSMADMAKHNLWEFHVCMMQLSMRFKTERIEWTATRMG